MGILREQMKYWNKYETLDRTWRKEKAWVPEHKKSVIIDKKGLFHAKSLLLRKGKKLMI